MLTRYGEPEEDEEHGSLENGSLEKSAIKGLVSKFLSVREYLSVRAKNWNKFFFL